MISSGLLMFSRQTNRRINNIRNIDEKRNGIELKNLSTACEETMRLLSVSILATYLGSLASAMKTIYYATKYCGEYVSESLNYCISVKIFLIC